MILSVTEKTSSGLECNVQTTVPASLEKQIVEVLDVACRAHGTRMNTAEFIVMLLREKLEQGEES